ncbi:hypothetical protein PVL29_018025 [Vitis rotundifolia]|uniref:Uncharacterized protein n=1 Tax=Vitis rotundifolia TaxID=103349 RepID=A0AA38Z454_VITRO|nr:hypothetical protein PVL29_018025 [Vitis rotundifolia]
MAKDTKGSSHSEGTQDFEKFYEPRVISFGPYHHGKCHLHPVEMIKPLCAKKFLADSNQDIKALYQNIESNIEAVRKCYDCSTNEYDDEALAWMMLLDGCFLLYFIHCVARRNQSKLHGLNVKDHLITFVHQDLFLLENQLPFGVLKLIFKGAKFNDGSPMEEKIKKFVTDTGSPTEIQLQEENAEPSHLLDLLRSALLGRYKRSSKKKVGSQTEQELEAEKKGESSLSSGGEDGESQPKPKQQDEKKGKQQDNWHRTISLRDISFNSSFFYSHLKLPPITIDDSTKPRFLNMVAYEMCPEGPDDYGVTSYICFLDNLIDHADDVKELRSKHILYNCLGSDEDVAQIFNEIANDLVVVDAYGDVKAGIQTHYDKRWKTWIAEAIHDNFRSPWTITGSSTAVIRYYFLLGSDYFALPGNIYILD